MTILNLLLLFNCGGGVAAMTVTASGNPNKQISLWNQSGIIA